jgi:hypothetical protein
MDSDKTIVVRDTVKNTKKDDTIAVKRKKVKDLESDDIIRVCANPRDTRIIDMISLCLDKTSLVFAPPPKIKTWLRAEEKRKQSYHKDFESVAKELNELVELDITAPENVPHVGTLMTRMLFLDFVAQATKINKSNGVINATNRTADYFDKNPHNKTKNAYLWGIRMYSELHNCLTLVEARAKASDCLLDLSLTRRTDIAEHDSLVFVNETIYYIKAYNLLMDIVAKKFKTPELILAKISLEKIIRACVVHNTAFGKATFDVENLIEQAPQLAKSEILHSINHSAATLFSAMVAGYNVLLVEDCEEVEL